MIKKTNNKNRIGKAEEEDEVDEEEVEEESCTEEEGKRTYERKKG